MKLLGICATFLLVFADCSFGDAFDEGGSPRKNICLNGWWEISVKAPRQPSETYGKELSPPSRNKADWHPIVLPQNLAKSDSEFLYHQEDGLWQSKGGPGAAWFRRSFTVPPEWKGKRVLLRSGGICYDSVVYINGKLAGHHRNQMPFVLDVARFVEYGDTNTIYIGYQSAEIAQDAQGNPLEPVAIFTKRIRGIIEDLFLEAVGGTYIDSLGIDTDVEEKELAVSIELNNPQRATSVEIKANIYDGEALIKTIGAEDVFLNGAATGSAQLSLRWPEVCLWQPDDPHLYRLELTVSANGKVLDQWRQRLGFREFIARDGKFHLNGNPITLVGTSHYYNPDSSMFSPDYVRAYYRALKAVNINTCRLHGIPFPSVWLRIADEEGMLIVSEALFRGGEMGKSKDYLPEERWPHFEDYYREWVVRERNHPSVAMWAVYNEGVGDLPLGKLYDIVRQTDKTGRPVYSEGHCEPWNDFDTDVISLHYQFSFNEFPFWPADLYYLDPAEPPLYERLSKYPFYAPAIRTNVKAFIDANKKARLLSDFAKQPFGRRWTVEDESPRPLSFGESLCTWFFSFAQFSRFAGPKAFSGVYDAENGGFWRSFGSLVGDAIDAYRYMGVNHYSYPWQPDNFAFVQLFNPDGSRIVKEQKPANVSEPGYHPTRLKSYYSRVNPGWNPDVPEHVVTATGRKMAEANQPVRMGIKPNSLGFYANQTLVRDFSVNNNRSVSESLNLTVAMAGTNVLNRTIRVEVGETLRDSIEVPLTGFPAGIHELRMTLAKNGGETVQISTESIRIAARDGKVSDPLEVLVFDPTGETKKVLNKLGVDGRSVSSLDSLPNRDAATLVVGENAIQQTDSFKDALEAWLEKGGQVLLLAQRHFGGTETLFSGRTTSMDLPNARTFICAPDHDIAKDLLPLDFHLWGDDHMVTRLSMAPFDLENARYIAVQGGKAGLSYPVVSEFLTGSGRIVWLQCLCVSKFDETPSAMMVLKNTLEYMDKPWMPLKGIARRTATPGFHKALSRFALQSDANGQVRLCGSDDVLAAEDIASLRKGDLLWINNPSAAQLRTLGRTLDQVVFKKTDVNHPQLERCAERNPLLEGITNWELFLDIDSPLSEPVVDLQNSGGRWVPLIVEPQYTRQGEKFGSGPKTDLLTFSTTFPFRKIENPGAAMVVAETDAGGLVILDTIRWDALMETEQAKVFLAKFMTNMGLGIGSVQDADSIGIVRQEALYRVNCGETKGTPVKRRIILKHGMPEDQILDIAYMDHAGNEWLADQPWSDSARYGCIGGNTATREELSAPDTTDDMLFRTERYGNMGYRFRVDNGAYRVRLYFLENFTERGKRIFSVELEGKTRRANMDVFREVGSGRVWVVELDATVNDGLLDIGFIKKIQNPFVNAIEVLPF